MKKEILLAFKGVIRQVIREEITKAMKDIEDKIDTVIRESKTNNIQQNRPQPSPRRLSSLAGLTESSAPEPDFSSIEGILASTQPHGPEAYADVNSMMPSYLNEGMFNESEMIPQMQQKHNDPSDPTSGLVVDYSQKLNLMKEKTKQIRGV